MVCLLTRSNDDCFKFALKQHFTQAFCQLKLHDLCTHYFLMKVLKMGHPRPLFHLFSSFQSKITFLQQTFVKKSPSSIRFWDSNPQPSEHESPPITTRQGFNERFIWNNGLTQQFVHFIHTANLGIKTFCKFAQFT